MRNNIWCSDGCGTHRKLTRVIYLSIFQYQNAGVIEAEACFKAARVAVELNHVLQAASFLQNIIFINLVLPEEDKVKLIF